MIPEHPARVALDLICSGATREHDEDARRREVRRFVQKRSQKMRTEKKSEDACTVNFHIKVISRNIP